MKLIVGYFALIGVLLTGLFVFANQDAVAETEATEPEAAITLQKTSSEPEREAPVTQPVVDSYRI